MAEMTFNRGDKVVITDEYTGSNLKHGETYTVGDRASGRYNIQILGSDGNHITHVAGEEIERATVPDHVVGDWVRLNDNYTGSRPHLHGRLGVIIDSQTRRFARNPFYVKFPEDSLESEAYGWFAAEQLDPVEVLVDVEERTEDERLDAALAAFAATGGAMNVRQAMKAALNA